MENNGQNNEKKKKKTLLWIIIAAIVVIVGAALIFALQIGKERNSSENGHKEESIIASGSVTAPEVPTKEAKTEAESKKDSTIGKDAKTDDKQDNKTDNKQNGTSGQNTGTANTGGNTQQGQSGNTNTNTNKPSGNNGNTSGGNTSGSGTGGNTQPSHTHNWQAVYKTVNHPAVTEQVWVEDQAAWDEPQYAYHDVCYICGLDFNAAGFTNDDVADHQGNHLLEGNSGQYGTEMVQVGTIHHEAVGHYETRTITAAWSEQVFDHYECSCGATK